MKRKSQDSAESLGSPPTGKVDRVQGTSVG